MASLRPRSACLSRAEYERMAEARAFPPGFRGELLEGEIVPMTPQSSWHAAILHIVADALRPHLLGTSLRNQAPLALDDWSEPEPDISIVPGSPGDYFSAHPRTALLVVEVAHSSLSRDRKRKVPLYAAAGIAEVWVVAVERRYLDVFRQPEAGRYRVRLRLRAGDRVAPLFAPAASIAVAELVPTP